MELDPLAAPWLPPSSPGGLPADADSEQPAPWPRPLESAQRRLALAALHHPRLGAASGGAQLRELALLQVVAQLLPAAREPLQFTAYPMQLQVSEDGARVSKQPGDRWGKYRTAVCTNTPMTKGVHYAEFRLVRKAGWLRVGVVNADLQPHQQQSDPFNALSWAPTESFDARCGGSATASSWGWGYNAALGSCWHKSGFEDWVGQRAADSGDTVGLLLDVNQGCLDVFLNGERLGRMVDHSVSLACAAAAAGTPGGRRRRRRSGPGEQRADDAEVDEEEEDNHRDDGFGRHGLCWMVELHDLLDVVEIEGKHPPTAGPTGHAHAARG